MGQRISVVCVPEVWHRISMECDLVIACRISAACEPVMGHRISVAHVLVLCRRISAACVIVIGCLSVLTCVE